MTTIKTKRKLDAYPHEGIPPVVTAAEMWGRYETLLREARPESARNNYNVFFLPQADMKLRGVGLNALTFAISSQYASTAAPAALLTTKGATNNAPAHTRHAEGTVLYEGLGQLIAALPDTVQYVLLGDTNHADPRLEEYFSRTCESDIRTLHAVGFTHGIVEMPATVQPLIERYAASQASEETLRLILRKWFRIEDGADVSQNTQSLMDSIVTHARVARETGAKIHCPEDRKGDRGTLSDRFRHEQRMGQLVQEALGDEKAWLRYGSLHFKYRDWLVDYIGRDKSVAIDVYPDREAYLNDSAHSRINVDYQPDYIFLLKENIVIAPRVIDGRGCDWRDDPVLACTRYCLQDDETEAFVRRVEADTFLRKAMGRHIIQASAVLDDIKPYWHRTEAQRQNTNAPERFMLDYKAA